MRVIQSIGSIGALVFLAGIHPASLSAQSAQDRLWDASMRGDTTAMAAALKDGAQIDSLDTRRNPNGRRALNWAAWYDHSAAVRLLTSGGAQVNLANRTGFTPLHHAAENGSLSAARALLAAGADPDAANGQGQLPGDVARDRSHPDVAALIDSVRKARTH
jgi:ankyrin repeat protein